ncbi:hypothetical protein BaRGS_00012274 [Batillaria attramentaria]|uniref:GDT1 family protein n=1 Tax=Batillaria attramentaria TaxID=370345 RepID=A0ABD0LA17_9CAEN
MEVETEAKDPPRMLANMGGFVSSLLASLSFITLSEVGDKTFFIAAILAMRHSRMLVFSGAMVANTIMYILTVGLGFVFTVVPHTVTKLVSSALFAVFGIQMIREGKNTKITSMIQQIETCATNSNDEPGLRFQGLRQAVTSSTFVRAFSLTFVAEWGDRSQLATILLGASQNITGVLIGGLLGHTVCTCFAVVSGHLAARHISLPKVHILGGLVFLVFAVATLFMDD